MESIDGLKSLDRAAAAPFLNYPTTPIWYPALTGACCAVVAAGATLGISGRHLNTALLAVGCVLFVLFAAFVVWYRKRWGTWPDMRQAPPEIAGAYRAYLSRFPLVFAVAVLACALGGAVVGGLVTFLGFTAFIGWYERRAYPAACQRVRERLA